MPTDYKLYNLYPKSHWKKLTADKWLGLLSEFPEYEVHCDWNKLEARHWVRLLLRQPKFKDKCNWMKLSEYDWDWLAQNQSCLRSFIYKNKNNYLLMKEVDKNVK